MAVSDENLFDGGPILKWYAVGANRRADCAVGLFSFRQEPGTRIVETGHLGLRASGSHDILFDTSCSLRQKIDVPTRRE